MGFMMLGFPAVASGTGGMNAVAKLDRRLLSGPGVCPAPGGDGAATLIGLAVAGVFGDLIGIQTTVMFGRS